MTLMSPQPASCSSSTATTVFGSCISARIPSCMRAPPDAETDTSGVPAVGGALARPRELLAGDGPHRAAHEGEVHHRELAPERLDRGGADHHRVAEPGRELRLRETILVRTQVEEAQRIRGAEVGRLLLEAVGVGELRDPLARLDREVVAAVRAHAQRRLELVVAIVRATRGARVRMLLRRRLGRRVLVLDRDVDPARGFGHRLSLDPALSAAVTSRVHGPGQPAWARSPRRPRAR